MVLLLQNPSEQSIDHNQIPARLASQFRSVNHRPCFGIVS